MLLNFTNFEVFSSVLKGYDLDLHQIDRGQFNGSLQQIQYGPIFINRVSATRRFEIFGSPPSGLRPSVLSLAVGAETSLQLVARGAPAEPYRLPLTVSFDPTRVAIDSIATVEGVTARYQDLEPDEGWIELDLEVGAAEAVGSHGLAVLRVRALAPGPVPLVVTAGGATRYDGVVLPVAVGNGALFVTEEPQAAGKY